MFISCLIFFISTLVYFIWKLKPVKFSRPLLVIAHPDDECMFFGPTLAQLQKQQITTYILCLCNGNDQNMGSVRELELVQSAHVLGIPALRVQCLNVMELQDGMKNRWDKRVISKYIEDCKFNFDSVKQAC